MPRISDFPIKSNPSTSATLSGVDGGENVQIPVTTFAKPSDIPSLDGYVKRTELRAFSDALVAGEDADGNELTVGNAYAAERSQTAERLTVNAGSATQPVYFANGVPIATNLATVATSGSYNDLTDKPSIPSGGGSGGGIIDVDSLPTENIDASVIYRVKEDLVGKIDIYKDGVLLTEEQAYCEIVEMGCLPDEPTLVVDLTTGYFYVYYQQGAPMLNAYFDEATSTALLGTTFTGWASMGEVVTSVDDIPSSGAAGLAHPKTSLYVYSNGAFEQLVTKSELDSNTSSGGSSGGGIIDVAELPTENINKSAIYRVAEISKATVYASGNSSGDAIIVDELPEIGRDDCMYFLTTDQKLYGYASADMAAEWGIPEGWADQAELFGMPLVVSSSVDEVIAADLGVLLTKRDVLYCYCDGEFTKIITSKNFEFDETTGTLVLNL